MLFNVTILGSNGAVAAFGRYPSCQIVNFNNLLFMLDCGEGAQFRMNAFGVKRSRLNHIFISHLHGDHYYGLVGLLTTFNLHWREEDLHIFCPPALEEIVQLNFKHSNTTLRFKIHFHYTQAQKNEVIYEDDLISVETFPLLHRLPTTGFLFKEKTHLRKIRVEKIEEYNIPYHEIKSIKSGNDFVTSSGTTIPNHELTVDPAAPRSYAYCSDTAYSSDLHKTLKGVNLIYHEATFTKEHAQRAEETYHSTSEQAAEVAKQCEAKELIVGHFSARYENLDDLLSECRAVFPNTQLAIEGAAFQIQ